MRVLASQILNGCLVKVPRCFCETYPIVRDIFVLCPQHSPVVIPRFVRMILGNILWGYPQFFRHIDSIDLIRYQYITVQKQCVGTLFECTSDNSRLCHLEISPNTVLCHCLAVHPVVLIQFNEPSDIQPRYWSHFIDNFLGF